jgi:hypothetical protein
VILDQKGGLRPPFFFTQARCLELILRYQERHIAEISSPAPGGHCPPKFSGHKALFYFPIDLMMKKISVAQAFQPVLTQAEAGDYLFPVQLLISDKTLPDLIGLGGS